MKTNTKRILHIFGQMQRGGAEMRTLDIMRHIDPDRYRFLFCALSGKPGELDAEIRELGGDVFYLPVHAPSFPVQFIRLLRKMQIDAVHSHVHLSSGYLLLLAACAKVPIRIAHFRSSDSRSNKSLIYSIQQNLFRYLVHRYATNVVSVSRSAMESVWSDWSADDRFQVLYNGLDLTGYDDDLEYAAYRQNLALPADATIYIHVGRFTEAKNHLRLLAIFDELLRIDRSAYLLLVGRREPHIEQNLQKFSDERHLQERIFFLGERSDVAMLLRVADAMLFPSLWEGLPGVVLEASAIGLPVVASDIGCILEIQQHFATVSTVSLSIQNSEWARIAYIYAAKMKSLSYQERLIWQQTTLNKFSQTPFSLLQAVTAFKTLYQ